MLRHCHGDVSNFNIRIENRDCTETDRPYCNSQDVDVTLGATVIKIKRKISEKPELTIESGILDKNTFVEFVGGNSVVLSTLHFQMISTGRNLFVTVSPDLSNRTCGLCGTFNGDSQDDYHKYDGGEASTAKSFLLSWLNPPLDQQTSICKDKAGLNIGLGESEPTHSMEMNYCSLNSELAPAAETRASVLKDPFGPFAACLGEVAYDSYYDRALKAYCRNSVSLCDVVAGYAKACGDKGIVVENWRGRIEGCPERTYNFPQLVS